MGTGRCARHAGDLDGVGIMVLPVQEDDAFIYLHMAANIVEAGTARYFPITGSSMLLSSSPLRLLTLVPGLLALELAQVPLRTIEAARFAFLSSGLVSFLVFLPFWRNRLKAYMWVGVVLFLLGMSLDAVFLMEGGVLFLSLLSLASCWPSDPATISR